MRILHLFNYNLKDIEVEEAKEQGFDAIQISPVQPNKGDIEWWGVYQPISFSIGNRIGNKQDLINLCANANKIGIKIIVDVVLNHVAGGNKGELFPNSKVDEQIKNNVNFFKEKKLINDWNNRYEVINYCMGLPGLQLNNWDLQDIIINFLNELIQCGVKGFRFDAAKNIALPCEGNTFWERVLSNLNGNDLFNYAEVIYSPKYLIDEYCKYINVLTDSPGSNKDKLITFVESHDSFLNEGPTGYTKNMGINTLINEYRVLCKNFKHTILYARPYDNIYKSEEIRCINFSTK